MPPEFVQKHFNKLAREINDWAKLLATQEKKRDEVTSHAC